jgi:hypothetical protein
MHAIDLLKGEGLPAKTTIGSVVFTTLIFVLPLLIGALILGKYAINKTSLDVKEGQKERLKKEIASFQSDTKQVSEQLKEKKLFIANLNEVSKCVDTYIPWTPVLVSLARNIPDPVIIDNLTASNANTGSMRLVNDPNKPLTIPIPERKMTAAISGQEQNVFNLLVQDYEKKLNSEELLKPFLRELKYSIQGSSCTMNFTLQKQKK